MLILDVVFCNLIDFDADLELGLIQTHLSHALYFKFEKGKK